MFEVVLTLAMLFFFELTVVRNCSTFVFSVFLKKQETYKDRSVFLTQCEFSNTDCISFVQHVCCVLMILV